MARPQPRPKQQPRVLQNKDPSGKQMPAVAGLLKVAAQAGVWKLHMVSSLVDPDEKIGCSSWYSKPREHACT